MIYSLHKFCHYLLANHFLFYVDYKALLYLVNWPVVFGSIARWMLLFQEYDFEIVHIPQAGHAICNS